MARKTDEPLTPEVIPPSGSNASDRNRAYRIAKGIKEGTSVPPEDLEWYAEYTKAKQTRAASRSKRVTFTSEEQESAATGDAAAALAAPLLAREEGRRIDSLIREATNATSNANKMTLAACELVMKFAISAFARNGELEKNNVAMLDTFRKSHIELTHAHAALVRQSAEIEADDIVRQADDAARSDDEGPDMVEGIVQQFLPVIIAEMQKRAAASKGGNGG